MSLDLKDKKVRMFKRVIDCIAVIFLLAVIIEWGLALFLPQGVRSIDSDGKIISETIEFEKGSLPEGFRWRVESPEYKVEYFFNDQGMRDEAVHVNPKPKGLTRFLILGDSFAFGGGNDYEDVFTVIFEKELLNAGYNADVVKAADFASDTFSDVVKMENLSEEYDPDVVIFVIHANDLLSNKAFSEEEVEKVKNDLKLIKIPPKNEKGVHSIVLFKRILRLNDYFLTKWNLIRWWEKIYVKEGAFRKGQVQITKDILLRAKAYVDSRNIKLAVLLLPDVGQIIAKADGFSSEGIDWDANDEELKEFAKKQNILWISVSDEMASGYKKDKKDLFFRYDGHLTSKGNLLVGEYLFENIKILLR